MLRLSLKNLAANKIRLGLTALAIVLGVGFVVSSFVLRDGLKESFASLSEEIVGDVDISVNSLLDTDPLTDTDLGIINDTPGVRVAIGGVGADGNQIQPIKEDGTTITAQGPPQIAFSWADDSQLNPSQIVDGRPPTDANEWVIDIGAADRHDFVVGQTYGMVTPSGRVEAELVGTFRFGADNTTNGATLMAFELDSIRGYLALDDIYDSISIGVDGSVPVAELEMVLATALGNPVDLTPDDDTIPNGSRVEVQNRADLQSEVTGQFNQALDILGGVLLGFALIALFVSIFIIANTFSIVTSQRIRELGLLRAIGATPSQVRRSVLIESLFIGIVASLMGIVAGVGIAYGMRELLALVAIELPAFGVVLKPFTIGIAMIVGVVVTVVSAVLPAIKASRVAPVTAITGSADLESNSIGRYVVGTLLTAVGVGGLLLALFGGADGVTQILSILGAGAVALFLGLTLLSSLVAAPIARVLGAPLGPIFNRPGSLATDNAARNPRRTATTAAALMIGLSLVSMAMVLGDSLKSEFSKVLETSVQADYLITSDSATTPLEVVDRMNADPAFAEVTPLFYWDADFQNERVDAVAGDELFYGTDIVALDYSKVDALFEFSVINGSLAGIDDGTAAIRDTVAEDLGIGVGDTLNLVLERDEIAPLEVVAIFEESAISSPVMISTGRFNQISDQKTADWVAAKRSSTVSVEEADATFAALGTEYPSLAFDSSASFRENLASQIDGILNVLTLLLLLAIFIALIGIANTLALSVFERTREIGLLRAVGMTRRQTRRMIRWEAAIISGVGAVLGAAVGLVLGIVMVQAIPDEFLSEFSIPWIRIILMVVFALVAGLIAAVFPAFRSSRMNVLDAISHS
ncbi:MAG: putative ABC transport system permease protein [Verrucomicrobiales bacterium]|jgi:putative ABC transport system permease protein